MRSWKKLTPSPSPPISSLPQLLKLRTQLPRSDPSSSLSRELGPRQQQRSYQIWQLSRKWRVPNRAPAAARLLRWKLDRSSLVLLANSPALTPAAPAALMPGLMKLHSLAARQMQLEQCTLSSSQAALRLLPQKQSTTAPRQLTLSISKAETSCHPALQHRACRLTPRWRQAGRHQAEPTPRMQQQRQQAQMDPPGLMSQTVSCQCQPVPRRPSTSSQTKPTPWTACLTPCQPSCCRTSWAWAAPLQLPQQAMQAQAEAQSAVQQARSSWLQEKLAWLPKGHRGSVASLIRLSGTVVVQHLETRQVFPVSSRQLLRQLRGPWLSTETSMRLRRQRMA